MNTHIQHTHMNTYTHEHTHIDTSAKTITWVENECFVHYFDLHLLIDGVSFEG